MPLGERHGTGLRPLYPGRDVGGDGDGGYTVAARGGHGPAPELIDELGVSDLEDVFLARTGLTDGKVEGPMTDRALWRTTLTEARLYLREPATARP